MTWSARTFMSFTIISTSHSIVRELYITYNSRNCLQDLPRKKYYNCPVNVYCFLLKTSFCVSSSFSIGLVSKISRVVTDKLLRWTAGWDKSQKPYYVFFISVISTVYYFLGNPYSCQPDRQSDSTRFDSRVRHGKQKVSCSHLAW